MPDQPRPGGQAQPRGLGGTLKSKMGPLPLWGWLAIMTVIAVGYYLYAKNKSAQQPAQPAAGAPGVTVINQGSPPTSPPPEPKHKGKDDDDNSKGSGDDKKDDSEEAQDDKSGSGSDGSGDKRGGQGHRHHGARHH